MTDVELDIFLNAVTIVAAAMAVVNGLRYKSRGASAYLLAFAFILLGVIAQLYRAHVTGTILDIAIAVLFLFLIVDMGARAGKNPPGAGGKKR